MVQHLITKHKYQQIVKYLTTGEVPNGLANSSKYRLIQVASNFVLNDENELLFGLRPVIPEEEIDSTLQRLYDDPCTTGTGRDRFYARVYSMYHGISRRRVQQFLFLQPSYQQHRPAKNKKIMVARPIVSKQPDERWQMDFCDFSRDDSLVWRNNGYKYILSVIDHFSKYAWSFPCKEANGAEVKGALQSLFNQGYKPTLLQSDNGSHFKNEVVSRFLENNGVKQVFSFPYKPNSNGGVERYQRTMKRFLFQVMTKFHSQRWIDVLPKFLENYNTSVHSTTKKTPSSLYLERDVSAAKDAKKNTIKRAKKAIHDTKQNYTQIFKGDYVRVYIGDNGPFAKSYHAQWSADVFRVRSVFKKVSKMLGIEFGQMFTLEDTKGTPVKKLFKRSELLQVPPPEQHTEENRLFSDIPERFFNRETHLNRLHKGRRGQRAEEITIQHSPRQFRDNRGIIMYQVLANL